MRKEEDKILTTDGDFFQRLRDIERKAIAKHSPEYLEEYDAKIAKLNEEDDED